MAWNKEDRSFKTLINRRTTDQNKAYYEELGDQTINTHIKEVWLDQIPSQPPTESTEAIERRVQFTLTEDITVANQQSWYAQEFGNRLKNWISPKFNQEGDQFGYVIRLYDSSGQEIYPTDASDWFWDYQTGILTFNGSVANFPKPFRVSGYRYIGNIGNIIRDVYLDGTHIVVEKTDGSEERILIGVSEATIATETTLGNVELANYDELVRGINTGDAGPLVVQPSQVRQFAIDIDNLVLPAPTTINSPGVPGNWSYDDFFLYYCLPHNPENGGPGGGGTSGDSPIENRRSSIGLVGPSEGGNPTTEFAPIITDIELRKINFFRGEILIQWQMNPAYTLENPPVLYQIMRAQNYTGDVGLEVVGEVTDHTQFIDQNLDTQNQVWNYRIRQVDSLGVEVGISAPIWIWRGGHIWKRTRIDIW